MSKAAVAPTASFSATNVVSIASLVKQLHISFKVKASTIVEGAPGCGKTQVCRKAAIEFLSTAYADVISKDPDKDLRTPESHYFYWLAPTKTAEFVGGIMMPDGSACDLKIPSWIFRIPNNSICHIDEIDKLPLREQMTWLQLIHEGGIDNFQLPSNVHWILTSNRAVDRGGSAGVNILLGNRARVYTFMPQPAEVLSYMAQSGFHYLIQAYLKENGGHINDYKADRTRNPTSRSWEMASSSLHALGESGSVGDVIQTVAGSVPDDIAQRFQLFGELRDHLVPYNSIMLDPVNAPMPKGDRGTQHLQITMIASTAAGMKKADTYPCLNPKAGKTTVMTRSQCLYAAFQYAERFPQEYMMSIIPVVTLAAQDSEMQGSVIPAQAYQEGGKDAKRIMAVLRDRAAILNKV